LVLMDTFFIYTSMAFLLLIGANFIPDNGVWTKDILSGKYVYGSPEFNYATRNWWISWGMIGLAVFIFIIGICLEE
jgi:hypothetical protein